MNALTSRLTDWLDDARSRSPLLDRIVRTREHYSRVNGTIQAAAVAYFAYLSFFPMLALAFLGVGSLARLFPQARADLIAALEAVLPGIIGSGPGQVSIDVLASSAGAVGVVGIAGLLYSGINWLSEMRSVLISVFDEPPTEQPSYVMAWARTLLALATIGFTLLLSVGISGTLTGYSEDVLAALGRQTDTAWALRALGFLIGGAADTLLLYALFRLLARPQLPHRALWHGALLGAAGSELVRVLSSVLIASTMHQPAFQAFGISLILLVWINYFTRIVVASACWAYVLAPSAAPHDTARTDVNGPDPAPPGTPTRPPAGGPFATQHRPGQD